MLVAGYSPSASHSRLREAELPQCASLTAMGTSVHTSVVYGNLSCVSHGEHFSGQTQNLCDHPFRETHYR